MRCVTCLSENPAGAAFCSGCGRRLPPATGALPEPERRQLTVMFCDLVGSTPLAERLDPEDLRDVLLGYQEACAGVIQRFDGHLAKYLGDGVLAYFGYPVAHEDDAERAVHTGLGIVGAMASLNARLEPRHRVRLEVRIGIHTGLVVAGEMGTSDRPEERAIVGETPNIAARLQGVAAPDCVVISGATLRLVSGRFVVRDEGTPGLKGVSEPIRVYRVLDSTGVRNRLEASAGHLTPLIGRDGELAQLLRAYERLDGGRGQCVLISGESGIGKSRLVHALRERLHAQPPHWMTGQCSPYFQDSPFHPVVGCLRSDLGVRASASPEEQVDELTATLASLGIREREAVVVVARLLSLSPGDGLPEPTWSPQRQKRETLATLTKIVARRGAERPALLAVEDMHWADASTLEWLDQLIASIASVPVLVLMTARPSFHSPWGGSQDVTEIALERLDAGHVAGIVESLTGGKTLPREVAEHIVSKTDGVPLFVEELTKMVLESNLLEERDDHYEAVGPLPLLTIPTTLQDSLMARLDRLGAAKRIAQLGSVLGREFPFEMLRAVANEERTALLAHLTTLEEARLLQSHGEERYAFHHALIRDAAYQSLLKSKRREYHQRAARALEDGFRETVGAEPELVAHHYTEAGLAEPAIGYWLQAGQRAIRQSANREAIEHLGKGLALVAELPDGRTRIRRELELQAALGPALNVTRGYGAPEVERTYARAHELCRQLGQASQTFWALWGLWAFHLVRGEIEKALELVQQLLRLAERQTDPAIVLEAHGAAGQTYFFRGDLTAAHEHLETGIALDGPDRDRSNTMITGGDVGSGARANAALVLWHLGFPDRARALSQEAIDLSRRNDHPYSLAFALTFAARLHQSLRDGPATRRLAEAVISLSEEQGFFWVTQGIFFRGCATAEEAPAESVQHIRAGLDAYRVPGAALSETYMLAQLADAHRLAGQHEAAARVLDEAFAVLGRTGEMFWEAELHRLRGELHLVHDRTAARRCFEASLDSARRQKAKSLELRSAMSMARLDRAAHDLLAEVYGWFREGFDTTDVREARALLLELG